ncbi:MAG: FAD-dependent oxidoreductase [Pseudomonadota bacterium]
MKRFDVIVLGAGMVGISTAIALQERGRSVALVDRRGPAQETSYGNAGLIQAEAVMPYAFPRNLGTVLQVLLGRRTDARVAWRALHHTAPWLLRYALASAPEAVMRTARANAPLVVMALPAHEALSERAGVSHLWRRKGYLRLFRSARHMESAAAEQAQVGERFGIRATVMGSTALAEREPHLRADLPGAIHYEDPVHVMDPGDLGAHYAALFEAEGGTIFRADAMALVARDRGFVIDCAGMDVRAKEAVVALGPWSGDFLRRWHTKVPLGVKRGYHLHLAAQGNAVLDHVCVDEEHGFVLAPNKRGIRLTTGAEFDRRDAPPTPHQLRAVEPVARDLFPLAEAVGSPWLGARPCLPDLLPIIGPIPGAQGLWANFGHHHLGFTLGPATGRLLAEMLTDEEAFTDPSPYRIERFGARVRSP